MVGKWLKIFAISYMFDMENSIILPDDLARFRIELENFKESILAPGYNVKVNLSLYREGGGVFSIEIPPTYYPLENATFNYGIYSGINFTLIDDILYSGEVIILNGFVNCTTSDILIRFRWTLIVDDVVIYSSEENFIAVM